jgi:hypothetical protein
MNKRLLATVFCVALSAATIVGAPAQASTAGAAPSVVAAAPHGKPCNAHGYKTKVRGVDGHVFVKLTRLAEKTYPGPTTIKKGTRVHSTQSYSIDANVTAEGGLELGAGAVLKKIVNVFSKVHSEVSWAVHVTGNKNESKVITMHRKVKIPHATSVVFFAGWMGAKGTGEYSYCDAIEGSGEGYVKWQKASWHTFGGRGSGGQDCRVKAYGQIAAAAKSAMCT